MRLLFTVVHFFRGGAKGLRPYGSIGRNPAVRVQALTGCLAAIHEQFGGGQFSLDHGSRTAIPANADLQHTVEIVICTTKEMHLLGELPVPAGLFHHHPTDADPTLLGYECHAVLRERLGAYDYYCYLEDDLILRDPLFFMKLNWFNQVAAPEDLLQPNRYEVSFPGRVNKVYVDGELPPRSARSFQNIEERPKLVANVMSQKIEFRRTLNPHSGAFFLTNSQMSRWAEKPYFLDRSARFIGPPESAASLGIMRTFRVYKPAPKNAAFLEIEHGGTSYLDLVGKTVPVAGEALSKKNVENQSQRAAANPGEPSATMEVKIEEGLHHFDL